LENEKSKGRLKGNRGRHQPNDYQLSKQVNNQRKKEIIIKKLIPAIVVTIEQLRSEIK